jgi:glycine cleavage system H protein
MVALFVILTIITFLTIDHFVQRWQIARAQAAVVATSVEIAASSDRSTRLVPDGFYLCTCHTWMAGDPSGLLSLGISPAAVRALGSPDNLCLLPKGTKISKDKPCFKLGRGQRKITLRAPVDGVIEQVNVAAFRESETISADPFGQGWIYKIKPTGKASLEDLLSGEKAEGWLRQEFAKLRDFLAGRVANPALAGSFLQDGGMPVEGFGDYLNEAQWNDLMNNVLCLDAGD